MVGLGGETNVRPRGADARREKETRAPLAADIDGSCGCPPAGPRTGTRILSPPPRSRAANPFESPSRSRRARRILDGPGIVEIQLGVGSLHERGDIVTPDLGPTLHAVPLRAVAGEQIAQTPRGTVDANSRTAIPGDVSNRSRRGPSARAPGQARRVLNEPDFARRSALRVRKETC
jgi:hypothetical protein